MASFHIPQSQVHWSWNPDHEPVCRVNPGDSVTLEVANASGGQLQVNSTARDLERLDFGRVNPVTGPIYLESAEPGDALIVEVLSIEPDHWGWTANIPGFGLLADQFTHPELVISRVGSDAVDFLPGIRIPTAPFIGTIGTAPSQPGDHPLVPPSAQGGNMDVRHMTTGSRLWLPVAVPGALLSVGDTHAAQGDGEVAGTAVETSAVVTLRLQLIKGKQLTTPRVESNARSARTGASWVTTGIGPDLFAAARQAVLDMIAWIQDLGGLTPQNAYLLASVAGDLVISEVVDMPNWVVSMHLSKSVLPG